MKVAQSCPTLWDPMDSTVHGLLQARILAWVTFPFSRGSSQPRDRTHIAGLPHCRRTLYQLSHKGNPRILEWVAYPFSNRSSWPRNRTGVCCIAGGFFTRLINLPALLSWWDYCEGYPCFPQGSPVGLSPSWLSICPGLTTSHFPGLCQSPPYLPTPTSVPWEPLLINHFYTQPQFRV